MGRFEFMPGVEKEGSPVYRQAHSKEIATDLGDILLYRWEKSSYLILSSPHQIWGRVACYGREAQFCPLEGKCGGRPSPPAVHWLVAA